MYKNTGEKTLDAISETIKEEAENNENLLSHVEKYALTNQLIEYSNELNIEFANKVLHIPQVFSWMDTSKTNESDELKQTKLEISSVYNQRSLGICWAVTLVGVLSDQCVIRGISKKNPLMSVSHLLSAFSNYGKCYGGRLVPLINNAILLKQPFLTDHCVDSSWIEGREEFYLSAEREFSSHSRNVSQYFQSLIPSKGCISADSEQRLFYLQRVFEISNTEHNFPPNLVREITIKHLLSYGPIILGFPVFKNFYAHSEYSEIYFEPELFVSNSFEGFHAVAIVGFGTKKIVRNGKNVSVPYWECRNSWGKNWGQNGLFKIAAYPWNKHIQFEHKGCVPMVDSETGKLSRFPVSVIFVVVDNDIEYNANQDTALFHKNFALLRNAQFYKTDESRLLHLTKEERLGDKKSVIKKCVQGSSKKGCGMAIEEFPDNFITKNVDIFWSLKPDDDENENSDSSEVHGFKIN